MILRYTNPGDFTIDVSDSPSDNSMSLLRPRSGGMMTTGDSGHGRGASSGSNGSATSPSHSSGGKSHGVSVNVVAPVVFMIVVVALGSVFFWWLLKRLRRSRGTSLWSLLMGSEGKPQLVEVSLSRAGDRDGSWNALQPVSADLVSEKDRERWKRNGHTNRGDVSTVVGSSGSELHVKKSRRGHRDFFVGKAIDLSREEIVEVRVAVLVAMPSPSRSSQLKQPDGPGGVSMEGGLCLGTIHASF